jgi:flagellar assembly protein FliH
MPDRIIRQGDIEAKLFSPEMSGGSSASSSGEDKPSMEDLLRLEYEKGLAKGKDYAEELVAAQLSVLKQAVDVLASEKEEAFKIIERQVVDLSLKIASVIVEKEISSDPKIILSIVKDVLNGIKDKSRISLFINPSDEDIIRPHLSKFTAGIDADIELIGDDSIEQGGVIAQTPSGRIDALIESQIEEIRKRLL